MMEDLRGTIDRSYEYGPFVVCRLEDGYRLHFFQLDLSDEEYLRRTNLFLRNKFLGRDVEKGTHLANGRERHQVCWKCGKATTVLDDDVWLDRRAGINHFDCKNVECGAMNEMLDFENEITAYSIAVYASKQPK